MPPAICAGKSADGSQGAMSNSLVIARSPFRTLRDAISLTIPGPIAEDLRQKGHQSSKRGNVSDSPGRDVFDPSEHASRRLRAGVEVQNERRVGRQLERDGAGGRVPP